MVTQPLDTSLEVPLLAGSGFVVRGRAIDTSTGLGQPGLPLILRVWPVQLGSELPPDELLAAVRAGQTLIDLQPSVGCELETTTDPDGSFVFRGVPPGRGEIAVAGGQRWTTRPNRRFSTCASAEIDVVLERSASLQVHVLDISGQPLPSAVARLTREGPGLWREADPSSHVDGIYTYIGLVPDAYQLSVSLSGEASRWADVRRRVELGSGEDGRVEVRGHSPAEGAIQCQVRFASGTLAVGTRLWLSARDEARRRWRPATVDFDGIVAFDGLQPGRYTLHLGAVDDHPPWRTVEVGLSPVEIDLVVPDRDDLCLLVVDANERPVPDISLVVGVPLLGEQWRRRTNAAGHVVFPAIPHGAIVVVIEPSSTGIIPTGFATPLLHDGTEQRIVLTHPSPLRRS